MSIDWNKIKSECQLAFSIFIDTSRYDLSINNNSLVYWLDNEIQIYDARNLFNFFDEQQLFIEIMFSVDEIEPIMTGCFTYNIVGEESNDKEFTTRQYAENAAFENAFYILEQILLDKILLDKYNE